VLRTLQEARWPTTSRPKVAGHIRHTLTEYFRSRASSPVIPRKPQQ
jgi:hypothetical protein